MHWSWSVSVAEQSTSVTSVVPELVRQPAQRMEMDRALDATIADRLCGAGDQQRSGESAENCVSVSVGSVTSAVCPASPTQQVPVFTLTFRQLSLYSLHNSDMTKKFLSDLNESCSLSE